ncbi:MAG: hypothetical protein WCJ33_06990 [Pseudomonadota bacterium]
MKRISFSLMVIFILFNCSSFAQLNKTTNTITFYKFAIAENKGTYDITLQEKKEVEGEFKITPTAREFEKEPNHLLISVNDNVSGKTEFETVVANPVDMQLEYLNEKNEYDRVNIKQPTGVFDLRIPMRTDGKTILIQLIQEDKSLITLKTIR